MGVEVRGFRPHATLEELEQIIESSGKKTGWR
jgi:hypothetical protein